MSRSSLLCALFFAPLFAQTSPAPIIIYNAASHLNPIAPGSFVSVDVGLIGRITPDLTVDLTTSDGAKVRLAAIVAPTPADVVNTTEVWVVIPQNAPLGSAVVTTTMGGVAYDGTISIRSAGPGIFTAAYSGVGPALALNYPSTPNALTSAAVPNGIMSLFATGLNGATAADVIVGIGTQAVTPLYAGPQGQPGLDQINFVIPPNTPIGCYIPLTISVRGAISNIATLSVNHDPYACAHPLGLSYSQMKTLDAGGTILLASLSLAAADNSGANQPVSAESAAFYVVLAYSRHVAGYSGLQGVPPQQQLWGQSSSSCSTPSLVNVTSGPGTRTDIFSAGAIALAGPGGKQLQLNQNAQLSQYAFYGSPVPADQLPFFTGGNWSLSATGGADAGAFTQNISLRPRLKFTNLDANTILSSQNDYTLRWDPSGFGYGDLINFSIVADTTSSTLCLVPAVNGEITIPNVMLARYKGKTVSFLGTVQTVHEARPMFTVPYNHGEPIRGFTDYNFTQRVTVQVQ